MPLPLSRKGGRRALLLLHHSLRSVSISMLGRICRHMLGGRCQGSNSRLLCLLLANPMVNSAANSRECTRPLSRLAVSFELLGLSVVTDPLHKPQPDQNQGPIYCLQRQDKR